MKPRHTQLQDSPNDDWARVELYRWQHGSLPGSLPLDESAGLVKMAEAIEKGVRNNFPTPFNVAAVLRYAAKQIALVDSTTAQLVETVNERALAMVKIERATELVGCALTDDAVVGDSRLQLEMILEALEGKD